MLRNEWKFEYTAARIAKARDWERGGQIVICNDLQKDQQEVYDELAEHAAQLASFDAWPHPEDRLQLEAEDWQFVFGTDAQ